MLPYTVPVHLLFLNICVHDSNLIIIMLLISVLFLRCATVSSSFKFTHLDTALKCFCSSCPTNEASCGPSSSCYVGKDFGPGQEVSGAADSYSWGCFSESEAAMKCQETDKYRCCSDRDKCNEHLDPPPIKCSCTSNSCPNGQDYVSCGSNSSCYVSLPFDSTTTTSLAPDSLVWGCFNKSEAKVKCSDTNRYSCCSSGDFCNENLDPPTLRSVEPTSTSAECNSVSGGLIGHVFEVVED